MQLFVKPLRKYADLLETVCNKGYKGHLLTIEVGSRSLPNTSSFTKGSRPNQKDNNKKTTTDDQHCQSSN